VIAATGYFASVRVTGKGNARPNALGATKLPNGSPAV
jgi:hypothetical protein